MTLTVTKAIAEFVLTAISAFMGSLVLAGIYLFLFQRDAVRDLQTTHNGDSQLVLYMLALHFLALAFAFYYVYQKRQVME